MDRFKDIRPYNDDEIRAVLDQLITDQEFLYSIASFYSPKLSSLVPFFTKALARKKLQSQLTDVHDVASMQDVIAGYMDKMIEDTTTSLTHSGMENLKEGRSYLFISNHRDIAMDPAFVNYMLYHAGHETLRIAIGDNLLKKPFVTDLMRLNKSFIVMRSLRGRELLQSLTLLSEYIHHCIEDNHNVWIAQREGRAKNGIDKTDPALLKMLAMSQRKSPLPETLGKLHIVPVSISYEYDACDLMKAEELYSVETTGNFVKTEKSDIESIARGMIGFKGDVHVAFGSELELDSDEPELIASEIDRQVLQNYKLRDVNYLALKLMLEKGLLEESQRELAGKAIDAVSIDINSQASVTFMDRLNEVPAEYHKHFLYNYANPVLSLSA
jgi:1-acyl-sn-glycerol-3-phosphate acyltransferase